MSGKINLKSWLAAFTFLLVVGYVTASGRTIYVDYDGSADFSTIQAAIDDSNDGDTIIVADGTYTGDGNRDIDFLGKAITLRSENGPGNCIIDCNGTFEEPHRGFYFHNGEDANSVLDGFTIRNGFQGVWGGGIRCFAVSPTIRNCIITNNRARDGGGIFCSSCNGVTFINCIITENSASDGGGVFSRGSMIIPHHIHNLIFNNCTFSSNSAEYGGAICVSDYSNTLMANCILWGDTALYCNEISMQALMWPAHLYISFSNVQGGAPAVCGFVLHWGLGNIDADPCFADAVNSDYHLKSEAGRWNPNSESWVLDDVTSPCIDAGNPGCPLGDEPNDVNNVRINMGAYGGTAEASKSPANWRSIADMTNDWVVDSNDLKVFVDYWLNTGQCTPSDLDRSQSVDFADFALMVFH